MPSKFIDPNDLTAIAGSDVTAITIEIDEAAPFTYIGKTTSGNATSTSTWQIQRLEDVSGDTTVTWADGDKNFDNEWDDRAGLSYS